MVDYIDGHQWVIIGQSRPQIDPYLNKKFGINSLYVIRNHNSGASNR